jgi:gas vesicle protein GvpN
VDIHTDDLQVGALADGGNGGFALPVDTAALEVPARHAFVETPFVIGIIDRALAYAGEGLAVHFRGPTGSGKTTLAVHLAELLGRPMAIVNTDDEYLTSNLVGGGLGYERKRTTDRSTQPTPKTHERVNHRWVDSRLIMACQQGHTLIYDAFNRFRSEASKTFLTVLEERILILPTVSSPLGYLRVHPDFTAIFTSNPREYAGARHSQDALLDRMITLDLSHFDHETEVAITMSRTGLPEDEVETIVDLVRDLRDATEGQCAPTVRACIMIGEIMATQTEYGGDLALEQVCLDVLAREISPAGRPDDERKQIVLDLIQDSGWD